MYCWKGVIYYTFHIWQKKEENNFHPSNHFGKQLHIIFIIIIFSGTRSFFLLWLLGDMSIKFPKLIRCFEWIRKMRISYEVLSPQSNKIILPSCYVLQTLLMFVSRSFACKTSIGWTLFFEYTNIGPRQTTLLNSQPFGYFERFLNLV